MQGFNLLVVFNKSLDRILMCKRTKEPYLGLSNFVGGKIESDEDGFAAAYRELEEETSITKDDITLKYFANFTYFYGDCYLEIYVGKLNKDIVPHGDEKLLYWSDLNHDFFNSKEYAGEGNIGHILEEIELVKEQLFDL